MDDGSSSNQVFKRTREAMGRPDIRFHDLRRSGTTMAAQAGATMRELMDRLGHLTPQTALLYRHAASSRQIEIAERLSSMVRCPVSGDDRDQPSMSDSI